MRKSTKRFLAILVSMLLCASLAVTSILACPWDPECDGPDDCHTYETDDGPVLHHFGPFTVIIDNNIVVESGDPDCCPGTYYYHHHSCDACGEVFTDDTNIQVHDFVLHAVDPDIQLTWYWECELCGYTCEYVE